MKPLDIVYDEVGIPYKVGEYLGGGGFGKVYQVTKVDDGTLWALKVFPYADLEEKDFISFQNESIMAMKVQHEHVINYKYIHDGKKYSDLSPYIIMEIAHDGSLADLIKTYKANKEFINSESLLRMYNQLIDGMIEVNKHVIHRDIKPENILFRDGKLIITDFGLAKITDATTRNVQLTFKGYGTPPYLAPEAWKMDCNTIQMDIYAMGMTFYEMVTLESPFNVVGSISNDEWRQKHLFEEPMPVHQRNSTVSPIISQVIMKMIEKSTNRRYTNWQDIKNDLSKLELPKSNNEDILNTMLQQKLDEAAKRRSKEAETAKILKEKEEHEKLIFSQFKRDIFSPINDLINEFNERTIDEKILIVPPNKSGKNISCNFNLLSGKKVEIRLDILHDDDFIRKVENTSPLYHGAKTYSKVVRPIYIKNNKKILAWGYLKIRNDIGYNILLLENDDELYGEWVFLLNNQSGLARHTENRPTPFAFEIHELEKELNFINAMHIYNTSVMEYDEKILKTFILNNN
ncbi:serine/threonine protein kinase [Paenibacillus sp. BJ-4]|uniref:serine/threonine protein kinase n=1 Tax=Paenibacillus sp. BJ-4 TaxID=2878097 RepID=UPI001CEFD3F0|nr:serine/threonine-protein kinase [Paenibacillus sp. BJ-4]